MFHAPKSLSLVLILTLLLAPSPAWNPPALHALSVTARPAAMCPPDWQIMTTPNEPGNNRLIGLSARAHDDVWAVGYAWQDSTGSTLLEHYNGTDWSLLPAPSPAVTQVNELYSVVALAPTNVWAVGSTYTRATEENDALLEHYDGAQWGVVAGPAVTAENSWLHGIAAVDANNLWAVGASQTGSSQQTLIMHYNGSDWSVVASPSPGATVNNLLGVVAVAANDVWAVGMAGTWALFQTLVLHYEGSTWSVVASPNLGTGDNRLNGVAFADATHGWAVGTMENGSVDETLVLAYDGAGWTAASPSTGMTGRATLWSATVISPTAVWAVGILNGYGSYYRIVLGWDGTEWTAYPTGGDNPGGFRAVARDPEGNLYAAGYLGDPDLVTLVEKAPPGCGLANKLYLPAALLQATGVK